MQDDLLAQYYTLNAQAYNAITLSAQSLVAVGVAGTDPGSIDTVSCFLPFTHQKANPLVCLTQ